ncbi:MAG TPA: tyrosine--tRNA ligase [Tepidisphaeraceae bacterium]|nr:tyrosine--tRNA ligase [Tepidisphaeraceae bacterium]
MSLVPSIDEQIRTISRRCERIVPESDLRAKLERSAKTGKPLRVKLGMDPTAPDVHLGHAVPLKVVRQFQDWGHKAVIIIGDSTARVGDPTGRNKMRPQLSGDEIDANAKTYVVQVGKILLTDPEHLEIRYNSEWLGRMGLVDIIKLASRKTVAQTLAREDFAKRYADQTDIGLHEILYPLLQGWDSVAISADIEMGGSDQLFNNLVGREFQKEDSPSDPLAGQVVIVTPLLVGTDGSAKMSKSKGNYIGVTENPREMFGKIMSLPDAVMATYYALLTELPEREYRSMIESNPRDAKVALAKQVIGWLHSPEAGQSAEDEFNRVFKQGGLPDDMPEITAGAGPHRIAPLIVKAGLASSNSEAIRKVREGAVSLDGKKVASEKDEITLAAPTVLKIGRKFARLTP